MKNTKHTPAPWVQREHTHPSNPYWLSADVMHGTTLVARLEIPTTPGRAREDMALIFAAPELLEMLEDALDALNQVRNTKIKGKHKDTYEVAALAGALIRRIQP